MSDNEMMCPWPRAAISLLGVMMLGGCGEVAYKRGSGPDAFTQARADCQERNADPAAVGACLSGAGWNVTELEPGPAAAAAVETLAPHATPVATSTPAPVTSLGESPAAPSGKLSVGSWWKFGAGAADLHDSADACLAGLGPEDKPDTGYHLVTRALYRCLGRHGWHGIGSSAS